MVFEKFEKYGGREKKSPVDSPLVTLETKMEAIWFENDKGLRVDPSQESTKGSLVKTHVKLYTMSLNSTPGYNFTPVWISVPTMFLASQRVVTMNFVKLQTQAFEDVAS